MQRVDGLDRERSCMDVHHRKELPKFAVLGAGNGGTAMAGHLSLLGCDVSLYNRSREKIQAIQGCGGIDIITDNDSCPSGFAPLKTVTGDMEEAIKDRRILMVVVPAFGHKDIAVRMAPFLTDGQIVVLNPGRTGGALEVLNAIRTEGCTADVIICEAQTLLYACRSMNPAQTKIFGIKNSVPIAAIPAHRTPEVVNLLRLALPQFAPGDNVIKTSLDNIGAIFHPAVTVLNAARIECTQGNFDYYTEGITPAVALILEKLDQERVNVAEALGFRAMSAREWLYIAYNAAGRSLFEAIRNNRGYDGIKAPKSVYHRYITEDVPMSLVPIASLGQFSNIPTPTIDAIIHLASVLHQTDYLAAGRSVESMGLKGMTLKQVHQYILDGIMIEQR